MDTNQRSEEPKKIDIPPSIEELESMLGKFQPEPGPRFYQRMQKAPWLRRETRDPRWLLSVGRFRWATYSILACLVIAGCFLAFPSLRAAGGRLFHFFSPANSDRQNIQLTVPTPGLQPEYSLTLEQAQQTAGYLLHIPAYLPPGLQLDGARYNSLIHSVGLRYSSPTGSLIFNQRPTRAANESSSIGSSAPVVTVQVGDRIGEYVSGGWKLVSDSEIPLSQVTPGTPVNLRLYWDPELPQQILRWEMGDMTYEIISSSGQILTKEELIQIAESIH